MWRSCRLGLVLEGFGRNFGSRRSIAVRSRSTYVAIWPAWIGLADTGSRDPVSEAVHADTGSMDLKAFPRFSAGRTRRRSGRGRGSRSSVAMGIRSPWTSSARRTLAAVSRRRTPARTRTQRTLAALLLPSACTRRSSSAQSVARPRTWIRGHDQIAAMHAESGHVAQKDRNTFEPSPRNQC